MDPITYDMIKGNESDVSNIDFELKAKRNSKFFMIYIVLDPHRIIHTFATRHLIETGSGSLYSISNRQVILKNKKFNIANK